MFCSQCGAKIDDGDCCPNCGFKNPNNVSAIYAPELSHLKIISNIAAICSVFLPVIGFVLGIYCLIAIKHIDEDELPEYLYKMRRNIRTNAQGSILLSILFSGILSGILFL